MKKLYIIVLVIIMLLFIVTVYQIGLYVARVECVEILTELEESLRAKGWS